MTLPLISVSDHDVQFNFDQIAKVALDTGGRQLKLRIGTATISFTASVTASVTVTHGIGSTPLVVLLTASSSTLNMGASAIGSTTFSADGRWTDDVARTSTQTVYWLAIG